jgi:transposase-like protein
MRTRSGHTSEWAAIRAAARTLDVKPQTLRNWVRQSEIDAGTRPGVSSQVRARVRALERENAQLRRNATEQARVGAAPSPRPPGRARRGWPPGDSLAVPSP